MCCDNDFDILKRLLAKDTKEIKAFKVVTTDNRAVYQNYKFKKGVNRAKCRGKVITWTDKDHPYQTKKTVRQTWQVFEGMHVKRTLKAAIELVDSKTDGRDELVRLYKIIRVTGKMADLIGANQSDLVFTKIKIESLDGIKFKVKPVA